MTTRREFLRNTALASAGLALSGISNKTNAASYSRIMGSNEKINLAHIGIGNRGWDIINDFDKTGLANVVALCDVDLGAEHTQKLWPNSLRQEDLKILGKCLTKWATKLTLSPLLLPIFAFPCHHVGYQHG